MIKNVLIVDDDREMLLSVREGLEKYDESFSVLIADDGEKAVEKLRQGAVSLVVTDLKMPRMNGFSLLAHIMEHTPDIPVIIVTAYSTRQMEDLAKKGGAVGYIEKPFMIEDLARKIVTTLRKESEGGTLHGVSSGAFLQLIEMEQKTCTIRIVDRRTKSQGVLFFLEGELLDARVNRHTGLEAAYRIFSWDEVNISIQNSCPKKKKTIEGDLQAILLEAMRRKDESGGKPYEEPGEPPESLEADGTTETGPAGEGGLEDIRHRIQGQLGPSPGIDEITTDTAWERLLDGAQAIGERFQAGRLRVAYMDRKTGSDLVLLPGRDGPTVLTVNPRCPRDKILRILIDQEVTHEG